MQPDVSRVPRKGLGGLLINAGCRLGKKDLTCGSSKSWAQVQQTTSYII